MNLLAQLTAAAQPPRLDKRTVRSERIVPGSSSEQILTLLADGRVWSSIAVADQLNMHRCTARSAMDRLVRFGHLDCVGRVESDRGSPTPLKIYRRKT